MTSVYEKRSTVLKKIDKDKVYKTIANYLPKTNIMFIYFGGSIAFNNYESNKSDMDINVIADGVKGYSHSSCSDYDLFIYGKEAIIDRQNLSDNMSQYSRLFIDDVLSIKNTIIYINPEYKVEFVDFLSISIEKNLYKLIELNYNYYYFFYKNTEKPTKRFYHIIRIAAQLINYKKTEVYSLDIDDKYRREILWYKNNYSSSSGLEFYKTKIGEYLSLIKAYMEEFTDVRN